MSIESKLRKGRLGIAAATAGIGMILGGCVNDPSRGGYGFDEKQLNTALGIAMGASGNPAIALGGLVTQHENNRQHELEVAQAGRSEMNVNIVNGGYYPGQQATMIPTRRNMRTHKYFDLNGNGVQDPQEHSHQTNDTYRPGDRIAVTIWNMDKPTAYVKFSWETYNAEQRVNFVEEGLAEVIPSNTGLAKFFSSDQFGIGRTRITAYEVLADGRQFPIAEKDVYVVPATAIAQSNNL